jgi:hypothetical protein
VNTVTNQTIIEDLTLVDAPQWWQSPWTWVAIALVLAGVIWALRRYFKSQALPLKPMAPEFVGPPPHLEALRRLEELRAGHAKLSAYDVAVRCSEILRSYVEARFNLPIRFQTTREFLGAALTSPELSTESREELGAFLRFFDGIKFARESAEPSATSAAIDGAEKFVRRCIPPEVVTAA